MGQDERTYHRLERMTAIARWAIVGTQEKRRPLPIEADFLARVERVECPLFVPLDVRDTGTVQFHQQVSYLIDAFDGLPMRVDVAFDSAWKAFESATEDLVTGNITDRLSKIAKNALIDEFVLDELTRAIPTQSCEFLFKRIVSDSADLVGDELRQHQPNRRLLGAGDDDLNHLVSYLKNHYGADDPAFRRKGAMLLRKAICGEPLVLGARSLELSLSARTTMLLHGLLYTSRNERVHGESFSPFVSSDASIKTYTHPYFLFLASYYLLLGTWTTKYKFDTNEDLARMRSNLERNIAAARKVFGRHWSL